MRKPLAFLLAALCAPALTTAQLEMETARERLGGEVATGEAVVTGEATLNLAYDDGEPDNGVRANFPASIEFAMRFDAGQAGSLNQIQVCFQRLFASDDSFGTFPVNVYSVSGGTPGILLHAFTMSVSSFPVTVIAGQFRTFNLPSPAPVPASFFLGVEMDSITSDLYLCVDEDGASRPIYASLNDGPWIDLGVVDPTIRKLMIRARVETQEAPPPPPPPSGSCTSDADTLCLVGGRYRVEIDYATSQGGGASGAAGVVPGITYVDSGLFYFFQPNNWELLIKVIDACVLNNRVWIFYAATTNVGFTVTVTDTLTGEVWTRTNPDLTTAAPVQDTSALGCGPGV